MPIVRIDIQEGKSVLYKRSILHGVRSALTDALGVPDDRIMQRIIETPVDDIDATEVKSDRLTIIEISMLPRPAEVKEKLYTSISKHLGFEPGIAEHDLIVLINDPAAECFFLNGFMQCTPAAPSEETS